LGGLGVSWGGGGQGAHWSEVKWYGGFCIKNLHKLVAYFVYLGIIPCRYLNALG
jgi:hypothetical protein